MLNSSVVIAQSTSTTGKTVTGMNVSLTCIALITIAISELKQLQDGE